MYFLGSTNTRLGLSTVILHEKPNRSNEGTTLSLQVTNCNNRPKPSKLVVAFPLGAQDYGNSIMTGLPVSG